MQITCVLLAGCAAHASSKREPHAGCKHAPAPEMPAIASPALSAVLLSTVSLVPAGLVSPTFTGHQCLLLPGAAVNQPQHCTAATLQIPTTIPSSLIAEVSAPISRLPPKDLAGAGAPVATASVSPVAGCAPAVLTCSSQHQVQSIASVTAADHAIMPPHSNLKVEADTAMDGSRSVNGTAQLGRGRGRPRGGSRGNLLLRDIPRRNTPPNTRTGAAVAALAIAVAAPAVAAVAVAAVTSDSAAGQAGHKRSGPASATEKLASTAAPATVLNVPTEEEGQRPLPGAIAAKLNPALPDSRSVAQLLVNVLPEVLSDLAQNIPDMHDYALPRSVALGLRPRSMAPTPSATAVRKQERDTRAGMTLAAVGEKGGKVGMQQPERVVAQLLQPKQAGKKHHQAAVEAPGVPAGIQTATAGGSPALQEVGCPKEQAPAQALGRESTVQFKRVREARPGAEQTKDSGEGLDDENVGEEDTDEDDHDYHAGNQSQGRAKRMTVAGERGRAVLASLSRQKKGTAPGVAGGSAGELGVMPSLLQGQGQGLGPALLTSQRLSAPAIQERVGGCSRPLPRRITEDDTKPSNSQR